MKANHAVAVTLGALTSLSMPACKEQPSQLTQKEDQPSSLRQDNPNSNPVFQDPLLLDPSFDGGSLEYNTQIAPGVLSDPFRPAESGQPLTLNPSKSIVIYLNDLSLTGSELLRDTQQLADQTIIEARYLNVGSDHRVSEATPAGGPSETEGVVTLELTANSLLAVVDASLESGRTVHIVAHDAGMLVAHGLAYHLGKREGADPCERLHLLMVGSPDIQNDPELILELPSNLGSLFRVTTRAGSPPLEKFSEYLPHLTPEMLVTSGRLVLDLGDSTQIHTDSPRRLEPGLEKSARQQIRRAAERAAQQAERLRVRDHRRAIEGEIDAILEGIRSTEYLIDDLDNRITKLEADFDSLADTFDSMRGEMRKIAESQRITREELQGLANAVTELESSLAKLIRDYGSRENYSMRITVPVDKTPKYDPENPKKSDFDGDGVSDKIESKLLETFRPVLAFHEKPHALPISAREFRRRCINETDEALEMPVERRNLPTSLDEAIIYGRVAQPREYSDTNYYIVQYYILFANNETSNSVRIDAEDAKFYTLGFVDVAVSASRREAPSVGDHEGDWVMLDLTVSYSGESSPQIEYGILHNHGRQFFVSGSEIETRSDGRPVVYLENGVQELLPRASYADENGYNIFPRLATTNKRFTNKYFNDSSIIQPHEGKWKVDSIPVFNLGEVKSNSRGAALLDGNGYATPVDKRTFERGSKEWLNQQDAKFILSYPGMWGDSNYRIKVDVGVPFTDFKKKRFEKTITSPKGPVFNSASNRDGGVVGKYYSRNFQTGGESFYDDYQTSSRVRITTSEEGNMLKWDPIPYAHGYVVSVLDSTGTETVHIANGSLSAVTATSALEARFEHTVFNGYRANERYTYRVEALWAGPNRIIPNR